MTGEGFKTFGEILNKIDGFVWGVDVYKRQMSHTTCKISIITADASYMIEPAYTFCFIIVMLTAEYIYVFVCIRDILFGVKVYNCLLYTSRCV